MHSIRRAVLRLAPRCAFPGRQRAFAVTGGTEKR